MGVLVCCGVLIKPGVQVVGLGPYRGVFVLAGVRSGVEGCGCSNSEAVGLVCRLSFSCGVSWGRGVV